MKNCWSSHDWRHRSMSIARLLLRTGISIFVSVFESHSSCHLLLVLLQGIFSCEVSTKHDKGITRVEPTASSSTSSRDERCKVASDRKWVCRHQKDKETNGACISQSMLNCIFEAKKRRDITLYMKQEEDTIHLRCFCCQKRNETLHLIVFFVWKIV